MAHIPEKEKLGNIYNNMSRKSARALRNIPSIFNKLNKNRDLDFRLDRIQSFHNISAIMVHRY